MIYLGLCVKRIQKFNFLFIESSSESKKRTAKKRLFMVWAFPYSNIKDYLFELTPSRLEFLQVLINLEWFQNNVCYFNRDQSK